MGHRAGRRGTPPCIGRDVQPTKWVARLWVARLWPASVGRASARDGERRPAASDACHERVLRHLPHPRSHLPGRHDSLERHSDTTTTRSARGDDIQLNTPRTGHGAGRRGTPPCIGRDVQPTKWVARLWPASVGRASPRDGERRPAASDGCHERVLRHLPQRRSCLPHRAGPSRGSLQDRPEPRSARGDDIQLNTPRTGHGAPGRPARDAALHRTRRPTHKVGRASVGRLCGSRVPARWRAASRRERWMPRTRPAALAATSLLPPAPGRTFARVSSRSPRAPRARGDDIQLNTPRTGHGAPGRPARDAALHRTRRPTHKVGRASVARASCGSRVCGSRVRARWRAASRRERCVPRTRRAALAAPSFSPPGPTRLSRTSFRHHHDPKRSRRRHSTEHSSHRARGHRAGRRGTPPCIGRDVQPTGPASDETSNPQSGPRACGSRVPARWRAASRRERCLPRALPAALAVPSFSPPGPTCLSRTSFRHHHDPKRSRRPFNRTLLAPGTGAPGRPARDAALHRTRRPTHRTLHRTRTSNPQDPASDETSNPQDPAPPERPPQQR